MEGNISPFSLLLPCLQVARVDMMAACRRSFVHGPLLLLRYTLSGLPWGAMLAAAPPAGGGGEEGAEEEEGPAVRLGRWVERMLDLLEQVSGQKGAGGKGGGKGEGRRGQRRRWRSVEGSTTERREEAEMVGSTGVKDS